MRFLLLSLLAVGCTHASTVRVVDVHGNALASTSRLDAVAAETVVQCGSEQYVVVPRTNPFLMGTYVAMRPETVDTDALCARVQRN